MQTKKKTGRLRQSFKTEEGAQKIKNKRGPCDADESNIRDSRGQAAPIQAERRRLRG